MDELAEIQHFAADIAPDPGARARCRARLLDRIESTQHHGPRWMRVLVLAAAAMVAVAFVTAALAFGDRVLDALTGRPASRAVSDRVLEEANAERLAPLFDQQHAIQPDDVRGVVAAETSEGPAILWAATTGGTSCWLTEIVDESDATPRARSEATCAPAPSSRAPVVWAWNQIQLRGRRITIVAGRLDPSAASLTLGLPDGRERTLASRDGFFLGELPDERDEYRLVARDSVGTEVGRQRVNRFLADVHSRMFAKVIGAERTVIDTVDTHGRPLRLSLVPTKDATCVRITTATGTGTGCSSQLRADQGISVFLTLSGSMIYLEGSVGPEVAELELDYQDGNSAVLPIVERFVLSDIDASHFQAGKRPYRLIARDREGNEVARQPLSQGVFGPDSGIWSGSAP